jgi:LAO/AO transport system kinase
MPLGARDLARAVTAIENGTPEGLALVRESTDRGGGVIAGITGPPGVGKSSLVDALAKEIRGRGKTVAILAVDPTSRRTGGAILGDRIRMQQHHADDGVFIRSMATRGEGGGLARATGDVARWLRGEGFDYVVIETVGVGQDEVEIAGLADVTVVVLAPGMGDDIQAIKAGIMEVADLYVINKADHAGADRAESELHAESHTPILRTIATEGKGVVELLDRIDGAERKVQPAGDPAALAVKSMNDALRHFESALGLPPGSLIVDHLAEGSPKVGEVLLAIRRAI